MYRLKNQLPSTKPTLARTRTPIAPNRCWQIGCFGRKCFFWIHFQCFNCTSFTFLFQLFCFYISSFHIPISLFNSNFSVATFQVSKLLFRFSISTFVFTLFKFLNSSFVFLFRLSCFYSSSFHNFVLDIFTFSFKIQIVLLTLNHLLFVLDLQLIFRDVLDSILRNNMNLLSNYL